MSDTYITNQPVIPPNQNDVAAWKQAYIDLYALGREATDDYLQACARITELEQEQIALWHTINTQATYAEELEAQSAQRWEPLPDGAVTETTYGERVEIMTGSLINIIDGEDDCHGYELPDNIRLCRRVTQEPTP